MNAQPLRVWLVDDDASIRAEMAPYVNATPEELWRLTEACARDAMWALAASDVREAALATRVARPGPMVRQVAGGSCASL